MFLVRVLVQSLLAWGALHLLSIILTRPGFVAVFDVLRPGPLPLLSTAIAASSGLHNGRAAFIVLAVFVALWFYPTDAITYVRVFVPVIIGWLLGMALRLAMAEWTSSTPQPPSEKEIR